MTAGGRQATSSSERMRALDSPRLLAWGAASSLWVIAAVVRKARLMFLVLPGLLALGAALFRHWPFGGNQHMVFAAPPGFVLVAEGLAALRHRVLFPYPAVAWMLVASFFCPGSRMFVPDLAPSASP